MQPVIFGTAGHIDHGKTALVKALTGQDTDRLKEEIERGITIELGYAFLSDRIAFIDVPGHERFVKNMVAGAATIDFALLVVAADDGVMPQTREHFEILNLLGVQNGLAVITKCDLADPDWIDLVAEDIHGLVKDSFLENNKIFRVDALSKKGISELEGAIKDMAATKRAAVGSALFRMPVDRVFSIKGFGTVVTGSVLSGVVDTEDRLELLPRQKSVRVRRIESHGAVLTQARAGMRAAVNLSQVGVEDISRGDILAAPGYLIPTFMLDVSLSMLASSPISLRHRDRVRLHVGTKELLARVALLDRPELAPGDTGLLQLRLEEKTAVQRRDRFVVRRYSPPVTIGGGEILDANPTKHRKRHTSGILETLQNLQENNAENLLLTLLTKSSTLSLSELVAQSALPHSEIEPALTALKAAGLVFVVESKGKPLLVPRATFETFESDLVEILESHHAEHPFKLGPKKGEVLGRIKRALPDAVVQHFLQLAQSAEIIDVHGDGILAVHGYSVQLTKKERQALNAMAAALAEGGTRPPDRAELVALAGLKETVVGALLQLLVDQGDAINLEGKLYFHRSAVEAGLDKLSSHFEGHAEISLSEFRILLDTTRKFAMPLLNYFDNQGATIREGDVRRAGPKLRTADRR